MTVVKVCGEYIYINYPTIVYDWEPAFWKKPSDIVGALNLQNKQVVYKTVYIQKKVFCGFEQFDAKHSLTLFFTTGKEISVQFEDEDAYKSAITTLEHEFLY